MKKIFFVIAAAAMMLVGCTKELEQKVNDLDNRVTALEEAVKTLNSNTASIQTILDALNAKVYVSSVTQTENGYEILFTDGKKAVISNGAKGDKGDQGDKGDKGDKGDQGEMPEVGIKADTDGVLYWTLNGEFLLVNGAKVPATGKDGENGQNGLTPKFELDKDGNLWVTIGEEKTNLGLIAGSDGDAWFSKLEQKNGYVVLTLADGTGEIALPLYNDFALTLETEIAPLEFGETTVLKYNVTGSSSFNVVAQASEGWTAVVNKSAKTIAITAPGGNNTTTKDAMLFSNGSILVAAADNETDAHDLKVIEFKYDATGARLIFVEATNPDQWTAAEDTVVAVVNVSAYGGVLEVPVATNAAYDVDVKADWIAYTGSKAMRLDSLVFAYEKNTTGAVRATTIDIKIGGKSMAKLGVNQKPVPTSLKLTPNVTELVIADSVEIKPIVTPTGAETTLKTWSEEKNDTAALAWTSTGKVVVNAFDLAGYKKVMAKNPWKVAITDPKANLTDTALVTIKAVPVTEISVPSEFIRLKVNEKKTFEVSVLPLNASHKRFTIDEYEHDQNANVIDFAYDATTGKITLTANDNGYVTLTLTAVDMFAAEGAEPVKTKIEVVVTNDVAPTGVNLKLENGTVLADGGAAEFHFADTLFFAPVNAADAADTLKEGVTFQVLKNGQKSSNLVVSYSADTSYVMVTKAEGVENYMETLVGDYTLTAVHAYNPEVVSEFSIAVKANLLTNLEIDTAKLPAGRFEAGVADTLYMALTKADTIAVKVNNDADDKSLRFWSSDETVAKVASVDTSAVITPLKSGQVTIYVEALDKFNTSIDPADHPVDSIVVCVASNAKLNLAYNVAAINMDADTLKFQYSNNSTGYQIVTVDETFPVVSNYATDLTWKVYDETGLNTRYEVDQYGKLTLKKDMPEDYVIGMVDKVFKLVASPVIDPAVSDSLFVRLEVDRVNNITLGADSLKMYVGDVTTLEYTIDAADDQRVKWFLATGDDEVEVVDGKITAKKAGKAFVIIEAMDKFTLDSAKRYDLRDTCMVEVTKRPISKVTIASVAKDTIKLGESYQFTPSWLAAEADSNKFDHTLEWSLKFVGDPYMYGQPASQTLAWSTDTPNKLVPVKVSNPSELPGSMLYNWNPDISTMGPVPYSTYEVIATSPYADANGKHYADTVLVTVDLNLATSLSMNFQEFTIEQGDTYIPEVIVNPSDASNAGFFTFKVLKNGVDVTTNVLDKKYADTGYSYYTSNTIRIKPDALVGDDYELVITAASFKGGDGFGYPYGSTKPSTKVKMIVTEPLQ